MSDIMTRGVIMMPLELAMSSELSRMQFHSRAQDVLRERDTYRQLCVDMLEALQYVTSSDTVSMHVKYTVSEYINKAEQQLNGDKNGNTN